MSLPVSLSFTSIFTSVVEFLPPSFNNVSVDCRGNTINVNHQTTKTFPGYQKLVVNLHKWKITPSKYLMVDLKCEGTSSFPAQGEGFLVVYGVKGTHGNVLATVFDTAFLIESGMMTMETTLNIQQHNIANLKTPSATVTQQPNFMLILFSQKAEIK